jgi:ABC-type antimicrobial peptide transport system permease subunit
VVAPFVQAVIISLLASLLAGIYPALMMGRLEPVDSLRYE